MEKRSKTIQRLLEQLEEHLLELKLPGRERAADAFLLLGKHKMINDRLAKKLAKAVGFRNILIHEYTKIDHRLVYHYYKEDLDDLRRFAKQIAKKFL